MEEKLSYKLIVIHMSPDLDAVMGVWMLRRFDEEHCGQAVVDFVPAGTKMDNAQVAKRGVVSDEVAHVDTGGGRFDHHTQELALERVCAASLVRDYLIEIHPELEEDEALARMSAFAVEIDHFGEIDWPEPNADRYLFQLDEVLKNLKSVGKSDLEVVEFGGLALDAVYGGFGVRVEAEEELGRGIEFESPWGRALGMQTSNDEVIKFGQKSGYVLVVRKDPDVGNIRIKAVPDKKIDLTEIYEKIMSLDLEATWYLHPAKTMLLNGSRKHQGQVPSKLSLQEVIDLIKSTK